MHVHPAEPAPVELPGVEEMQDLFVLRTGRLWKASQ